MYNRPRCETGVVELDREMNGGIPVGNTVLLSGASGIGKTSLCMHFLFNGAQHDEKGIYFSTVESLPKTRKHLKKYKFFDEQLIDEGKVSILDLWIISERLGLHTEKYTAEQADMLLDVLTEIIRDLGVKRLVVDSVTSLCHRLETTEMIRNFILKLNASLALVDCTSLLTAEIPPGVFQYSSYEIEEFLADGIIFFEDYKRKGELIRTLQLIKMRGTPHSRTKYAMNLSSFRGIELSPLLKSQKK